jgi:taurine dioxygenase
MTEQTGQWRVTRLAGALGAEIHGAQLAAAGPAELERVRELLLEHQVIFFPGQSLDPDQHVALGRHFGPLEGHPNLSRNEALPEEIFELRASAGGVADEWHTDLTFQQQPARLSILHMVECPAVGGDTLWADLYAAYEGLSAPMRALCEGLSALHDAHPHNHPEQTAIHPVVRCHPDTGRKALYVNEHFTRRIVELNAPESEVLLKHLTGWVSQPRFTVRYRWQPGTVAFWDNCCTQHFVVNDFEGERIIQRVTVMGDRVEAAAELPWPACVPAGALTATSRHDRQLYFHLREHGLLP